MFWYIKMMLDTFKSSDVKAPMKLLWTRFPNSCHIVYIEFNQLCLV